jgi:hypothetical protein
MVNPNKENYKGLSAIQVVESQTFRSRVKKLRSEAATANDWTMVQHCADALRGDIVAEEIVAVTLRNNDENNS